MATTMVHIRVDQKTKQRAAKTLAAMGMSVSDAVRMLLLRVAAEKALPFEVKVPNATTVKAMRAAGRGKGKRLNSAGALFKDLGIRYSAKPGKRSAVSARCETRTETRQGHDEVARSDPAADRGESPATTLQGPPAREATGSTTATATSSRIGC